MNEWRVDIIPPLHPIKILVHKTISAHQNVKSTSLRQAGSEVLNPLPISFLIVHDLKSILGWHLNLTTIIT